MIVRSRRIRYILRVSEFTVRPALVSDAEEIQACLRRAFGNFLDSYTREAFRDTVPTVEDVRERFHSMSLFVAEDRERKVIGTVAWYLKSSQEGYLRGMAVLPEWQGKGVAQRLLQAAEADIRRHGCSRVALDTTDPLERAIHFYEKQGFRRTGYIEDFFGMPLHEFVKEL
jgi:[ribosomal protein S18]-alanine N-acetyltransferase